MLIVLSGLPATEWREPHLTLDAADPTDVNLAKALEHVAGPSN